MALFLSIIYVMAHLILAFLVCLGVKILEVGYVSTSFILSSYLVILNIRIVYLINKFVEDYKNDPNRVEQELRNTLLRKGSK